MVCGAPYLCTEMDRGHDRLDAEGGDDMTIPAIALRGLCVLPKMVVHFDVSRKKSIVALEKAMVKDQKIFLVTNDDILGGAVSTH